MKTVEYRVRPVTRYVVTRYEREETGNDRCSGGSELRGEFNNETLAFNALSAFADQETILADPPDILVVTGHRVRTWTRGGGWSEDPVEA